MRPKRELQREVRSEAEVPMAMRWAEAMTRKGLQAGPVVLSLGRQRRTLDQNAKLWPMLTDVSRQVEWHGQHLRPEEWKDVFTAALQRQKVVPGLDGGFVVLGTSTRRMTKREFSDLIELIYAFGVERGVEWSEPARDLYEETRAA